MGQPNSANQPATQGQRSRVAMEQLLEQLRLQVHREHKKACVVYTKEQVMKVLGCKHDPSFYIRGVSFRQDVARHGVHKGDYVILCREFENPYDSDAVGCYTINGDHIGYVPRECTHAFHAGVYVAKVDSKGFAKVTLDTGNPLMGIKLRLLDDAQPLIKNPAVGRLYQW